MFLGYLAFFLVVAAAFSGAMLWISWIVRSEPRPRAREVVGEASTVPRRETAPAPREGGSSPPGPTPG